MPVDAKRVQAIFLAAVDLADAAERAALLDRECGGDGELRRRVEALLQAHAQPASILERPAQSPSDDASALADAVTFEPSAQKQDQQGSVTTEGTAPGAHEPTGLEFLQAATRPDSLGRLAHYEVLEVLGQGGFGIVVRAFDEKLQRVVAIKVMSAQLASTSPARKRFLREARAAAKVRHENVVQIYDIQEQPIPYLVMEYIPGRTLQQKLDENGPLEPSEMLRLAAQITRGLAAAHAQDLIHRDIKPGNILLEEAIEPQVKITDFGLARAADDASLTQSGVVAGTPMYMAPEQAEGQVIDQRADLFSLGSVFYVMLSGRPPFRASGTMAVLKRVCEDTPRPIRDIIPEVPDWLEGVIAKLHAKKPEDRFQTAAEVAEALAKANVALSLRERKAAEPRAVEGSTRGAASGRHPLAEREGYNQPRNRKPLLAATALMLAICIGITYFALNLRRPPAPPPPPQGTDKFFDALKRENIPPSLLALAGGGDPEQAPPELVAVLGDGKFLLPGVGPSIPAAQSADGKVLAVVRGNTVVLFDSETGNVLRILAGHASRVACVAFSQDGKRLASTGFDGNEPIRLWQVDSGKLVGIFHGTHGTVGCLAFSPDGKRIVSRHLENHLKVWDAQTGEEIFPTLGHTDSIRSVIYSRDGKRIVSASLDKTVKVWDADKGSLIKSLAGAGGLHEAQTVAFSPDGTLLAFGGERDLKIWDAKTLEIVLERKEPAAWLAFTADSRFLLAGKNRYPDRGAHEVTRWNLATGARETTLPLRSRGEWATLHLSPDGMTLYCMNGDDPPDPYVRAYDAQTGKELFPRQGHEGAVWTVAVNPNGRTIASGGSDFTVKLWDLAGWKAGDALPPVRTLVGKHKHTKEIRAVVFSDDGKFLASDSADGTIALWDVDSGEQGKILRGNPASYSRSRLAFHPGLCHLDAPVLAVGGGDGKIRFWSVATGKQLCEPMEAHGSNLIFEVAFSPVGRSPASQWLMASAGEDRFVRLWSLPSVLSQGADMLYEQNCGATATSVRFSPDGARLAAGCGTPKKSVLVWDITDRANWVAKADLSGPQTPEFTMGFQLSGNLVASYGDGKELRLWDLVTGGNRLLHTTHLGGGFSPKGGYVVSGNANGTISILRVPQPPVAYAPGSPQKLPDPLELAKRPSPADALKRENISPELLKKAGGGDPANAPAELVAILAPPQPAEPANLIWYDEGDPLKDAPPGDVYFRKAFNLEHQEKSVNRSILKITADDRFTAWINGVEIGSGDEWQRVFHFDVAKHLIRGANVLAVRANNRAGAAPNPAGLVAQLTIALDKGPPVVIGSDASWKTAKVGLEDWQRAGFNDSLWIAAKALGAPGTVDTWKGVPWDGAVHSVAITPDGKTLAAVSGPNINLWNLADGSLRHICVGHTGDIITLAISPDGKLLASASHEDRTVRLWDADTAKALGPLPGPALVYSWGLAFSPDGRLLVSSSHDGTLQLWNAAERRLQRMLRGHSATSRRVAFSPDGKLLASCGDDRRVLLWDVASGWQVGEFAAPQPSNAALVDLAFTPDGLSLVVAADVTTEVWDLTTRKLRTSMPAGHALALRADGKLFARACADGSVKLADIGAPSPREKTFPLFPKGQIRKIAFTPEGRYLATANPDGTVYILRLAEPGVVADNAHLQRREFAQYQAWAKAIAGRKGVQQKTATLAAHNKDFNFEDVLAKEPALVVGFTVVTSQWPVEDRFLVIGSVRPICLTADGIVDGKTCGPAACAVSSVRLEAKPGYAVGGIVGGSRKFKIVFMRIDGARLDPKDSYESAWLGGQAPPVDITLGCDGRPVVGIFGQAGGMIDNLGLVQLELEEKK